MADSARLLLRVVERGGVGDQGWVEEHEICGVANANDPAVGEPKPFGRTTGQMVDALFQAEQTDLADVMTEVPRKGAPCPRMWSGSDQNGVAATHVLGVHHDRADVLLVADVLKDGRGQLVTRQQIEEDLDRGNSTIRGDRLDRPSDVLVELAVGHAADLDGVPFDGDAVAPVGAVYVDVLADSGTDVGIL